MAHVDVAGAGARSVPGDRAFFGHPKGLAVLFVAEMWERFSYYGMRALLVLYLTQHFLFSDSRAQGLYAAYAALVYLMPLAGGFIADRYLGSRKAVTIGALFLTLGHFGMAFEGSGSTEYLLTETGERYEIEAEGRGENRKLSAIVDGRSVPLTFSAEGAQLGDRLIGADAFETEVERQDLYVGILFVSLSLIIVGVGFLKANIATIVGALYEQGDARRDGGFTIFYMGINIGSVLATFLCGWLGITYGWKYGFGLAGFGMLLGLITFLIGQPWLAGKADPPEPEKLKKPVFGPINWEAVFWIGGLVALFPTYLLVQRDVFVSTALPWASGAVFIGLIVFSLAALKAEERSRMVTALTLIAFSVMFWALFEQAASSLTLYAARNTELTLFGDVSMASAQVQLFNPAFIVLLAPVFAAAWVWLSKRNMNPSVPVKFALGLVQVGLGFWLLVLGGTYFADGDFKVPLIFLAGAYLLHTTGEICLSPVGLSMVTKLSPARFVGLMMGTFYVGISLGQVVAGQMAKLTASQTVGGVVVDPEAQLATYMDVFFKVGLSGVVVGLVCLAVSPLLKKGMAGRT